MSRFIGVDLHKNSFTVCSLQDGKENRIETYRLTKRDLGRFKGSLRCSDEVAVESTGNSGYFYREISQKVRKVSVINPIQFKIISSSVKKTDDADAAVIARYLSKGLIPEVRMRSKESSQLKSLLGTRDKLIKLRTCLKNKIHNILNAQGIVTKRELFSSEKSFDKMLDNGVDIGSRFELEVIIEQIKNLNRSIDKINEEIKDRGQKLEGHRNITSIKGIGNINGTILLNCIENVRDFADDKKLAAYFGIVPRVHISNETNHYGRITKMGDKLARTALVQSTLIAIRYNPYLRRFYDKMKNKKGSGKAIIATSRKLLTIIYRTLKNDWVFEDFSKFKLVGVST